jgi:putative oxidoreductase
VLALDRWFDARAGYAPALVRLIVGLVAVLHGWPKLVDLTGFFEKLRALGIPLPEVFGTAATLSEFLGGLCLIVGLFTRQAAFFFACVMAVAVFRVHWKSGFFAQDGGFEYPLVLLVASISLIVSGPGPVALDRLRGRRK